MTDHVGQVLRVSGASGLVSPSARIASDVRFVDRSIVRSIGWNFVDYRDAGPPFMTGNLVYFGDDPWKSEHAALFSIEIVDDGGSCIAFPPKRQFGPGEWLPPDGDLATRYNAGQEVFSGLISIAAHLVEADELSWLDAIATAARTEQGRRILDWMGVGLVRSDWVNAQTPCVLFECWGAPKDKWRTSKGFACVPEDPKRVVTTLDTERDTLTLDEPLFRRVDNGLYLYILKEDMDSFFIRSLAYRRN